VKLLDGRTLRVLVTTVLFIGALAIVFVGRRMFLALLFSIFFAYLLEPAVERVQRWLRRTRLQAIGLVYVVGILAIGAAVVIGWPTLQQESEYAATALPALTEKVGSGNIAWEVGQQHGWSAQTRAEISQFIAAHRDDLTAAVKSAGARVAEIGANAGFVILIPIFAFFFLKDKSGLGDLTLSLVHDPQRREFLTTVFAQIDRMLAQYIRAQLVLAALAMVAYTTFLSIVQFPSALVMGVIAGVLEFIPFVGPAITAALLAGIGFFSGYDHWLLVLAFVGVWRLIQDYVNTPYFMSEGLELHPLAAIFGILLGGEVFGIPGMFLSIPVIAGLRIVWHTWQIDAVNAPGETEARSVTPDSRNSTPVPRVHRRQAS
jgi:predicted PurR-regulated permease PerM